MMKHLLHISVILFFLANLASLMAIYQRRSPEAAFQPFNQGLAEKGEEMALNQTTFSALAGLASSGASLIGMDESGLSETGPLAPVWNSKSWRRPGFAVEAKPAELAYIPSQSPSRGWRPGTILTIPKSKWKKVVVEQGPAIKISTPASVKSRHLAEDSPKDKDSSLE